MILTQRKIFISVVCFFVLCAVLSFWTLAQALTLEWDRNSEPDMKDYGIFACFTPGCSVVVTSATRIGTVVQTAVGVKPTWSIAPNTQGAIGVTARDLALNESGLSTTVFFDAVAPSIPANPVLK